MLEGARRLIVSQAPEITTQGTLAASVADDPPGLRLEGTEGFERSMAGVVTDPIRLLNHLFIGDGPLPLPGPTGCAVDPTADTLAPCVYERCEA